MSLRVGTRAVKKEEARAMAQQFMELHRLHWPDFECECEVRPLENM